MNSGEWRKRLSEKLRQDKKAVLVLAVGLLLLLAIGLSGFPDASKKEGQQNVTPQTAAAAYEQALTKRLEEFLKNVNGVGEVKVCVTLSSLEAYEYARDGEVETNEQGRESAEEYVVIKNSGGDETGLCIRVSTPVVCGVAVVCSGGGSDRVRREVTSLLTAALGITANHVYVSEYSDS